MKFKDKLDFLEFRMKYERYLKIQYYKKKEFVLTKTSTVF